MNYFLNILIHIQLLLWLLKYNELKPEAFPVHRGLSVLQWILG